MTPNREDAARKLFEEVCNSPRAWRHHAGSLACALRVLVDASDHHTVGDGEPITRTHDSWHLTLTVQMLSSMVVENLLKGIIARDHAMTKPNGKLVDHGGHDLLKLARKAGINLSNSEEELLSRLTKQNSYPTRYPVPKSASQLMRPGFLAANFGSGADIGLTLALVCRLEAQYPDT